MKHSIRNFDSRFQRFTAAELSSILSFCVYILRCQPCQEIGESPSASLFYRSVSLTSCFEKLPEKTVHRPLILPLEFRGIVPLEVSRFHCERCTIDTIGKLVSSWQEAPHTSRTAHFAFLEEHRDSNAHLHYALMRRLPDVGMSRGALCVP